MVIEMVAIVCVFVKSGQGPARQDCLTNQYKSHTRVDEKKKREADGI